MKDTRAQMKMFTAVAFFLPCMCAVSPDCPSSAVSSLQCPDPSCKGDLLAYLNQMKLCSHQLRITSSVKADLRSSVKETVESANALITAAKNLMAAVVQTVKMCYIASKAVSLEVLFHLRH